MKKGRLITFEGPEGSGKSTHIRALAQYLRRQGVRCKVTREPGGTPVGELIRNILLKKSNVRISPETELFLYMAARAQIAQDEIIPYLKKGIWVLCDRFLDASLAYQGYGHGVSIRWIRELGKKATQSVRPDLTFLLDIDVRKGLSRARGRRTPVDRIESKPLAFHTRVRKGYHTLVRQEPRRFCVVNTELPMTSVQAHIRKGVDHYL